MRRAVAARWERAERAASVPGWALRRIALAYGVSGAKLLALGGDGAVAEGDGGGRWALLVQACMKQARLCPASFPIGFRRRTAPRHEATRSHALTR